MLTHIEFSPEVGRYVSLSLASSFSCRVDFFNLTRNTFAISVIVIFLFICFDMVLISCTMYCTHTRWVLHNLMCVFVWFVRKIAWKPSQNNKLNGAGNNEANNNRLKSKIDEVDISYMVMEDDGSGWWRGERKHIR